MFKNYLKVALRNLRKNKGYAAINIIGLAVGLATCLLIMIFVIDELSYDQFNKNADRIYRVDGDVQFGGNHFILAVAPDPMGPTLKKDFPQVEQSVRFRGRGGFLVKKGSENLEENRVIYADSTLFDVFTLPLIAGDSKTALVDPNSIVITEKIALKYFNTTEVVGKSFIINDTGNYKITGVLKTIPHQSHFDFDFFVSMSTIAESRQGSWVSDNFNTYILLKKGSDKALLSSHFEALVNKYVGAQAEQLLHVSMSDFKKGGNYIRYSLTPLTSIHLHSDKTSELSPNSSIRYVYIFSAIAIFILLIACVNFMNLSTARSSNRAKEVGIRKVLGSHRINLIYQFLSESVLLSFISLVLAILLTFLLIPTFNQLSGKELNMGIFTNPWLLLSLILLVLIVGILAGSYPAFYLSSYKPIAVLKGKLTSGFKSGWLRSSLVVFQFAISIFLIVGTIVIQSQLNYIRNKKLGYERDHVLVLQNIFTLGNKAKSFRQDLVNIPGIEAATMSGYLPTNDNREDDPLFPDASLDSKKAVSMQNWRVDEHYIPTLKMEIVKGRNFSETFLTDSSGVIINQSAARLLGFDDPLDKTVYRFTDFQNKKVSSYHIIGIVKDFNFSSLRQQVSPLVLFYGEDRGSIAMRINSSNIPALISELEAKWKKASSGQPFTYTFMDDDFNNTYRSEVRISKIALSFSLLAILIACLGLFGLVAYAAEQRTKEIGIRKVLGATVSNIVNMLSRDFTKLVLIATIIAFPVAWWGMNKWLQDFAYRITIGWWVFAIAGLIAIAIALITVTVQAIKAAIANPVKSLRTE